MPVPRGALAVVRHRAVPEALQVLRVRRGRRSLPLRRAEGGPRLPRRAGVPRRPGRHRARARGGGSAGGRAAPLPRPAAGAPRAHGDLLLAYCGTRGRPRRRATTWRRAGSTRRSCASSASATRPSAGTSCCSPRAGPASAKKRALRRRPRQRSKRPTGCYDRFRGRIMFPLADRRGRVLGFGARRLDDEGQGPEVPELRRRRHLPQGPEPLRGGHRAGARHARPGR